MSIHSLSQGHGTESSLEGPGIWRSDPSAVQPQCSFVSLVDLARMRFGSFQVEICEVCNTVNLGSPRHCKGCAHKLPAYYCASHEDPKLPRLKERTFSLLRKWHLPAAHGPMNARPLRWTLACLVVTIAESLPIH